jgi:nitroreductase
MFRQQPVESEKVHALIEAALRSPSSRGRAPWEFIVVTNRQLLTTLAAAKQSGSAFLQGAPLGIVVCGSSEKSDVWIEDCAIATTLIQLTAESLGLKTCWIQIRERMHDERRTAEEFIREVLDIPASRSIATMVAVGYPDEHKPPRPHEALPYEKVFHDRYGQPFS